MMKRPAFWATKSMISWALWPVSLLFCLLAFVRRLGFKSGVLSSWRSPVPVVIVGNISVGGAGKTPLVIALSEMLTRNRLNVGIVTRGYGGSVDTPVILNSDSDVALVGDEPLLLAKRTGLPVAVAKNRVAAVQHLIANHSIDCVLCDDGLQHYALERDIEIAVVDATYRFGNRFCLPAGPLREPVGRLATVDFTVYSGNDRADISNSPTSHSSTGHASEVNSTTGQVLPGYSLTGSELVDINDDTNTRMLKSYSGSTVHAVAGIASPENFYNYLHGFGISTVQHSFGDHAVFTPSDFDFNDELPVFMTEKDMVKCVGYNLKNTWYLPVSACLDKPLAQEIVAAIKTTIAKRKNNAG